MSAVHPTALVDPRARLADDASVGAYSILGPEVELGPGVQIASHVTVAGSTTIGAGTRISPYACIGGEPQVNGYSGDSTHLEIGRNNVIREHVTIHVGTPKGGGCTRVGDDNFIMNGAHIAHDCQVGSHCIVASFSGLAGHVSVGDFAVLGAYTGVHQFARVGESVMAASNAKLSLDAPPFSMVAGDRARLVGLNSVGLGRRDFDADQRKALKRAFHVIFHSRLRLEEALDRVRSELSESNEVERLVRFLEKSERGFCR